MAKIKFGMMMTDASGKLGGHVFAKNRGGSYVRTKGIPTNPQTAAQSTVRSQFAAVSSAWSGLTDAQRATYNNSVAAYAKTDIFGDLRNPSGKALFQRLNGNLALFGLPILTVCPQPLPVASPKLASATADISDTTIMVVGNNDFPESNVLVFATPAVSPGTSFIKNDLRVVQAETGATGLSTDVWADYVAKFGAPVVGANITIGVKIINENGQASPLETIKLTIQA